MYVFVLNKYCNFCVCMFNCTCICMSLFLINIVTFVYLCSTVHVYVYCLYKVAKLVSDHIVMFVDNKICLSKNIGFILLNLYSEYSRNTTGR